MVEGVDESSDDEALWRFSTAFYARAGVAEALIKLQDRAGFDVNLILFALWSGLSGRNRFTAAELAAAERAAGPIRSDLVEPLRALRRRLRSNPDADIQELREEIKRLELSAERILQNRLARIARTPGGENDPASRHAAAEANLALYLGLAAAGSAEAAIIRDALRAYARFGAEIGSGRLPRPALPSASSSSRRKNACRCKIASRR
jgi:uncharacterized protein (TIGR02444 family)